MVQILLERALREIQFDFAFFVKLCSSEETEQVPTKTHKFNQDFFLPSMEVEKKKFLKSQKNMKLDKKSFG